MKFLKFFLVFLFLLGLIFLFFYFYGPQKIQTSFQPILQSEQTWSLIGVGDIQLSREVASKIDLYGVDYPFEKTADLTGSANLTIGNLESPFFEGESNTDPNTMIFGAELKSVAGLKNAGFDALNLANNHFSNQGKEGENLTMDVLTKNDINYFGTPEQPLIKTIKNNRIAFLGYSEPTMDAGQVKLDIESAKAKADTIIVSIHAGYEYTPYANSRQIEFARAAVDAGAEVVLGHHPHVVQGIEDYKGKKIFYSLGNFIFDQPWSEETKQGLMVKLNFEGKYLTSTELIPIKIENWCQPRILASDEKEYQTILERIKTASDKL